MTAYVIADTEIVDPTLADRYREFAQKSIAHFGGRYIVRGGAIDPVEGDWQPKQRVFAEGLRVVGPIRRGSLRP